MNINRITLYIVVALTYVNDTHAQFSPGNLSRVHEHLEGTQNCTQCHEIGREISGAKCRDCHTEIQGLLKKQRGYHAAHAEKSCVSCHKEHLGRNARTVDFTETTFDHSLTGFPLTGKHASTACGECHTNANIKDEIILNILKKYPHSTYLGLRQECTSCHRDAHAGTFQQGCDNCHTPEHWAPATKFQHSRTRFPLTGRHSQVVCMKCHTAFSTRTKETLTDFSTQAFTDCSPCHRSPHGKTLQSQQCTTCHSPNGWELAATAEFNHSLTNFKLIGRHKNVACNKCHGGTGDTFLTLHPSFQRCGNCHSDPHKDDFSQRYNDDCSQCHSEERFVPSSFTLAQHLEKSRFRLTGAHLAVPCSACHKRGEGNNSIFRFEELTCETCHVDYHRGMFSSLTTRDGCTACHTTERWNEIVFDHATTTFPLVGRHAATSCSGCHKQFPPASQSFEPLRLKKECQSCHGDVHAGQFATAEVTDCSTCHRPEGWKQLTFDHNMNSNFPLEGGHARLECRACHNEETVNGKTYIRYKPLSKQCESCHSRRAK